MTDAIRTPEVSHAASVVAVVPGVRHPMVAEQRRAGEQGGVVMEGRDIGSVVFPHADLKIFLDASPEVRAERRQRELEEKGEALEFEKVLEEVHERDRRDREREMSPLVRAADAVAGGQHGDGRGGNGARDCAAGEGEGERGGGMTGVIRGL